MDSKNVSHILSSPLPKKLNGPNLKNPEAYIKTILKQDLPRSENNQIESELKWNYVLEKHASEDSKKKRQKKRKTFLTRKERHNLNILKLPKTGWNYGQLENMREMWKDYMRDNLDLLKNAPKCTDQEWTSFSVVLSKSELIGAEICIERSSVPSLVGLRGTIVLETKSTFQIVNPESKLKTIIKQQIVFTIQLDNMKFTIFGKHLNTRPVERSVKKIKSFMHPDL